MQTDDLREACAELERRLRGKRYFAWLKRRLDPDEARQVRELGIAGLSLVREPRRYYPHRELAGPLLGWAGQDAIDHRGERPQPQRRGDAAGDDRDAQGDEAFELDA